MSAPPEWHTFRHGEAWSRFMALRKDRPPLGNEHTTQQAWFNFLDGWLAKARQADELRNRR